MRPRHATISVLLSILLLGLTIPTASAGAVLVNYSGNAFPAGWPGTPTSCDPYEFIRTPLPRCVIDMGTWTELGGGHLRIRDMQVYDVVVTYREGQTALDPDGSGYEVVVLNANLDKALSGPAWGTWELYSFTGDPLFAGTYTGYYEKGVETARSVGRGVGSNAGQHIQAEVIEAPAGEPNLFGQILEPGFLDAKP